MTGDSALQRLNKALPHTMGCIAHRSAGPSGCICFHDKALERLLPVVAEIAAERARGAEAKLARVETLAGEMINHPDDSAADWGYDLAHAIGLFDVEPS